MRITKVLTWIIIAAFFQTGCGNSTLKKQNNAANENQPAANDYGSGYVLTSGDGYYMHAKVDGKEWVAAAMFKTESLHPGHTLDVMGKNENSSIYFRVTKEMQQAGANKKFTPPGYVAQLVISDIQNTITAASISGEVTITKISDKWVEGAFHFSGVTEKKDRTFEVSDGVFRIAFPTP